MTLIWLTTCDNDPDMAGSTCDNDPDIAGSTCDNDLDIAGSTCDNDLDMAGSRCKHITILILWLAVSKSWTKLLHAWTVDLHFLLVQWTSTSHYFII